jgi:hypothetical protein
MSDARITLLSDLVHKVMPFTHGSHLFGSRTSPSVYGCCSSHSVGSFFLHLNGPSLVGSFSCGFSVGVGDISLFLLSSFSGINSHLSHVSHFGSITLGVVFFVLSSSVIVSFFHDSSSLFSGLSFMIDRSDGTILSLLGLSGSTHHIHSGGHGGGGGGVFSGHGGDISFGTPLSDSLGSKVNRLSTGIARFGGFVELLDA